MMPLFGGNKRDKARKLMNEGVDLVQKKNDMQGGLKKFLAAIDADPTFHEAYNNAGNVYRLTGDPQKSLNYYNKCLELSSDDTNALFNRGMAHWNLKNYEATLTDLRRCLTVGGTLQGNLEATVRGYIREIEFMIEFNRLASGRMPLPPRQILTPEQTEQIRQQIDELANRAGQVDSAIKRLSEYIERNRGIAELYELRGVLLMSQQKHTAAITDLMTCTQLDPQNAAALAGIARLLLMHSQHDQGLPYIEKALNLVPKNGVFHILRGTIYMKQQQHTEAIADFDRALTLPINTAESAEAYYLRGIVKNMMGQFDHAVKDYDISLSIQDHAPIYAARSLALAALGRLKDAKSDMETYIARGAPGDMPMGEAQGYLQMMKTQLGIK